MVKWGCVIAELTKKNKRGNDTHYRSHINCFSLLDLHIEHYRAVQALWGSCLPQMRLWGFHHNTLPALKLFTIFDLSSNAKYLTALSRSGQVCFAFANKLNLNFYPQKFDPSKKSWPLKMLKHAKNPHIIIIVATTQFQRFQTPDLIWLSIILSITKYSAELSQ